MCISVRVFACAFSTVCVLCVSVCNCVFCEHASVCVCFVVLHSCVCVLQTRICVYVFVYTFACAYPSAYVCTLVCLCVHLGGEPQKQGVEVLGQLDGGVSCRGSDPGSLGGRGLWPWRWSATPSLLPVHLVPTYASRPQFCHLTSQALA